MISVKASMEIVIKVETQKDYEDMGEIIKLLSNSSVPAAKDFSWALTESIKNMQGV